MACNVRQFQQLLEQGYSVNEAILQMDLTENQIWKLAVSLEELTNCSWETVKAVYGYGLECYPDFEPLVRSYIISSIRVFDATTNVRDLGQLSVFVAENFKKEGDLDTCRIISELKYRLFFYGVSCNSEENFLQSINHFLDLYPDDDKLLLLRSYAYLEKNDWKELISDLIKIRFDSKELVPWEYFKSREILAYAYFKEGDYSEMAIILKDIWEKLRSKNELVAFDMLVDMDIIMEVYELVSYENKQMLRLILEYTGKLDYYDSTRPNC